MTAWLASSLVGAAAFDGVEAFVSSGLIPYLFIPIAFAFASVCSIARWLRRRRSVRIKIPIPSWEDPMKQIAKLQRGKN